ncbi:MAG: hypothetical protein ACJA0M_000090 [Chitinophagales bacterium]
MTIAARFTDIKKAIKRQPSKILKPLTSFL